MAKLLPSPSVRVWITLIGLVLIVLLSRADMLTGGIRNMVEDVRNDGPNQVGIDLITQNYYEELLKDDDEGMSWRGVGAIRRLAAGGPLRVDPAESAERVIFHETGFLSHSLRPNFEEEHLGVMVRTNRWGHRDTRDYEKVPEPGVFRIALIGGSNSLGHGVEVNDSFARILEEKLNETLPEMGGYERYEIVNFSVQGYQLLERTYVAKYIAPDFEPHLMLVSVTMMDLRRSIYERLARAVSEGRDVGFDFTREIVRRSHATSNDTHHRVEQRLRRFTEELARGAFNELAEVQATTGIPVVPIALRMEVERLHRNLRHLASMGESAGLDVLRIFKAYEDGRADELYLAPDDRHPSPAGHALLAEEIYERLLEHPAIRQQLLPNAHP